MKTLRIWSEGPEVCVLQSRLNWRPPAPKVPLSVDGIFGSKTAEQTKKFQKAAGLSVDCVVGSKTWDKLLNPEPPAKAACRYCDDVIPGNANGDVARSLAPASTGGTVVSASFLSLPSLPKLRHLTATEEAMARGVYGSSIDYSAVYVSDKTGVGGRAFVLAIPNPFGHATQIMNVGPSPTRSTMIHELAHVWQSQHHSNSTQFMKNAVASMALAEATNLAKGSKSFSAYAYRPGKPFGEYAAEQIAQQAENAEAAIIAHMKSVAAWKVDPENTSSLKTARIEDWSLPGVRI